MNKGNSIYCSTITRIGQFATSLLAEGLMITFKDGAPADLADYCFTLSHNDVLSAELSVGKTILLNEKQCIITAVGAVASENFKELGHVTLRFDGNSNAELPGTIHVSGEIPHQLTVGDRIVIKN